ncbi:AAA family ATPase [Candidatus Micrarchaeota archaeon]|nr:AAA family ATPase [Candidatus Micrarchaeota archaeon]
MDGLKELKGVVVIGTTNKPSILDPAILRPGRFDKIFYIPPPEEGARAEIFRINLDKFAKTMDLEKLAKLSEGFSGADIASVAQEIKMLAVRAKLAGKDETVTTETVAGIIRKRKPSITRSMLREYDEFLEEYGERT